MGGNFSGEGGLALLLIAVISLTIRLIIPFGIGFGIAFYSLSRIGSQKKGKFYIKNKLIRIITFVILSLIGGYISFVLLYRISAGVSSSLLNALSK